MTWSVITIAAQQPSVVPVRLAEQARELGRVIVPGVSTRVTSTFLPLTFLLSILGGLPSLSLNWLFQRSIFACNRADPAGKGEDHHLGRKIVALDRLDFQFRRRIRLDGGLDFHDAGASNVSPLASTVCLASSAPHKKKHNRQTDKTTRHDAPQTF